MTIILRSAGLLCLASVLSCASNISGWLVGSHCYAALEQNRGDIPSFVNWDVNLAIRYCSPNGHTRAFAVVGQDGVSVTFDPAGNEKAIQLGLNSTDRLAYAVKVTGNLSRRSVSVESLSVSRKVERNGDGAPGL